MDVLRVFHRTFRWLSGIMLKQWESWNVVWVGLLRLPRCFRMQYLGDHDVGSD